MIENGPGAIGLAIVPFALLPIRMGIGAFATRDAATTRARASP